MGGCGFKNNTKKTCDEKRLDYWFKMLSTILHATIDMIWGDLYDRLVTWRIFSLIINRMFLQASEIMRKRNHIHDVNLLIVLH